MVMPEINIIRTGRLKRMLRKLKSVKLLSFLLVKFFIITPR